MSSPEQGDSDDLRARLAALSASLRKREAERREDGAGTSPVEGSFGRAMSVGLTVFSEFAAAIIVGAAIGWQGDIWFGTAPLLLIVFLLLGAAAGFWNVYRVAAPKEPPSDAP
ncbi:MAG: AtpZ/AtpI family protein [Methylocystis sp.]|nr:AtpZ/AtpI family protein [Methylocystis sp.]